VRFWHPEPECPFTSTVTVASVSIVTMICSMSQLSPFSSQRSWQSE
jgi:hypothetical protein